MDLIIIGHVMHEVIRFPDYTLGPVLGGPAAYSSIVAARLGAQVGLVTRIGHDMPQELLQPLIQAEVDTRGMRRGIESRHCVLTYDIHGNKQLQFSKIGEEISLADVPKEYLDGGIFYLATLEGEVSENLIQTLLGKPGEIAVDLGGYGGVHCGEHKEGGVDKELEKIFHKIGIAKASREDCSYLFPHKTLNPHELARKLVDMGAQIGIITCGEDGVTVATANGEVFSLPPLSKRVKDCTGAGDAFSAGFLYEYHQTQDVRRSALFASATASLLIEQSGGITLERIPSLERVQARLAQFEG